MDDLTNLLDSVLSQSTINKRKKRMKLKTKKGKEDGTNSVTFHPEEKDQFVIGNKSKMKVLHTISSDDDSDHLRESHEGNKKTFLSGKDYPKSNCMFIDPTKQNKKDKVSSKKISLFASISSDDDLPVEIDCSKKNSSIDSTDSLKHEHELQDLSILLNSVLISKDKKHKSHRKKKQENAEDWKTCIPDSQENENSQCNVSASSSCSVVSTLSSNSVGSCGKSVLSDDVSIQECTSLLDSILGDPKKKTSKRKIGSKFNKASSVLLETVISDEDEFQIAPVKAIIKKRKEKSKKSHLLVSVSSGSDSEENSKEAGKNIENILMLENTGVSSSFQDPLLLDDKMQNKADTDYHLMSADLKSQSEMTFSTFIMDSSSDEQCEKVKTPEAVSEHHSSYCSTSDKLSNISVQDSLKHTGSNALESPDNSPIVTKNISIQASVKSDISDTSDLSTANTSLLSDESLKSVTALSTEASDSSQWPTANASINSDEKSKDLKDISLQASMCSSDSSPNMNETSNNVNDRALQASVFLCDSDISENSAENETSNNVKDMSLQTSIYTSNVSTNFTESETSNNVNDMSLQTSICASDTSANLTANETIRQKISFRNMTANSMDASDSDSFLDKSVKNKSIQFSASPNDSSLSNVSDFDRSKSTSSIENSIMYKTALDILPENELHTQRKSKSNPKILLGKHTNELNSSFHVSLKKSNKVKIETDESDSGSGSDDFERFMQKEKEKSQKYRSVSASEESSHDSFIVSDDDSELDISDENDVFYITASKHIFENNSVEELGFDSDTSEDLHSSDSQSRNKENRSTKEAKKKKKPPLQIDSDDDFEDVTPSFTPTNASKNKLDISDSDSEEEFSLTFKTPKTPTIIKGKTNSADDFKTPVQPPLEIHGKTVPGKRRPLSIRQEKLIPPATTGHSPALGFLKSLSQDAPPARRSHEALRYVKNFKKLKEELTARLFKLYNETVFENKLPSDMSVTWNTRLLKTAGYCAYRRQKGANVNRSARIELSMKVCDSAERLRDTLIHEMCHAAVWILQGANDGHGPYWKLYAKKANRIHPELPIIMRCHSYEINCKYIYKCTKCAYEIGRHSKSLDITKKCCGICASPFQLLINTKNGVQTPKTQATPKTPNRFALFVKENYGLIRSAKKGISHKDVMLQLSKDFAAKNKVE